MKLPTLSRPQPHRGGKVMAYALLLAGTGATVAANVAHAQDNIGAKALSAVIPALLFMAFHVAAYDGRWLIRIGTGLVALVCFGISYDHISGLAKSYGESPLSSVLYPLGIDGAMIVATFVLSRTVDKADAVLSAPTPAAVPQPVRPTPTVPKPVLSPVLPDVPEDKVPVNGFHRPMPKRTEPKTTILADNARTEAARAIAAELGDSLSRPKLMERLKEQGHPISTGAAAELVRTLKATRQEARA